MPSTQQGSILMLDTDDIISSQSHEDSHFNCSLCIQEGKD